MMQSSAESRISALRISLARSSSSHSQRFLERAYGEGQRVGRRAGPQRLGVFLDEAGDALARVAPVDQELDADAEQAVLAAPGQPHDLADDRHVAGVFRQAKGQTELAAQLQLA